MKQTFTFLLLALLSFSLSPLKAGSGSEVGNNWFVSAAGQGQAGVLEAPYPNPSSQMAFVKYELPTGHFTGELRVYSLIGQEVKVVSLDQTFGEVEIPTLELKSGIYFIYLVVDGKKMTSRKMIVTH